jgi:uncharacterized protein with GYD domain
LLEVVRMIFIVQGKFRKKPTKEMLAQVSKLFEQMAKEGTKFVGQYWTLGRYDITSIVEGKDEKTVMKALIRFGDILSLETLMAVPRDEAIKLVE